eukprot:CAMPEP_0177674880 /NCGR_PEP_ID=MMETSP0447-20121125/26845_1 /TAXON_ID=0 /ORGANISM="Stygamoeba regulata, Strain BSH-02190019" /LENGTH=1020 /DNA_ID=CAMNT_0019183113 /DNA_START=84 /DNA_END=3143 /DNA_ORIENTATION=-
MFSSKRKDKVRSSCEIAWGEGTLPRRPTDDLRKRQDTSGRRRVSESVSDVSPRSEDRKSKNKLKYKKKKTRDEGSTTVEEESEDDHTVYDFRNLGLEELPELPPAAQGQMVQLYLSYNKPGAAAAVCDALRELHLDHNHLTAFPEAVLHLPVLEVLVLSYNRIPRIPSSIARLAKLCVFKFSYNSRYESPSSTPSIGAGKSNAAARQGSGESRSPPTTFAQRRLLFETGSQDSTRDMRSILFDLPVELFRMEALQTLCLNGCNVSYLSPAIGSLTNLVELRLNGNKLTFIPTSLASLSNLRYLMLNENALATLPLELVLLGNLVQLYVQGNPMTAPPFPAVLEVSKRRAGAALPTISALRAIVREKWMALLGAQNWQVALGHQAASNWISAQPNQDVTVSLIARMLSEPDYPNNIVYKEVREGDAVTTVISQCTLEKLVQKLTQGDWPDMSLLRIFLAYWKSFCSAEALVFLLIVRYNFAMADVAELVRMRALTVIKKWVALHRGRMKSDLREVLCQFVIEQQSLQTSFPGSASYLASLLDELRDPVESVLVESPDCPEEIRQFPIGHLDMLSYSAKDIATMLTLITHEQLASIRENELMEQRWAKDKKRTLAPNITRFIEYFNKLSNWVSSEILSARTLSLRIKMLTQMIEVAKECELLNNFNSVVAIITALNNTAIHRLKDTWGMISAKVLNTFNSLKPLADAHENWAPYRSALNKAKGPCIPYLGRFLADITFAEDGNPSIIPETDMINFSKFMRLIKLIDAFMVYQMKPYALAPPKVKGAWSLRDYFEGVVVMEEKALYELSRECEPGGRRPVSTVSAPVTGKGAGARPLVRSKDDTAADKPERERKLLSSRGSTASAAAGLDTDTAEGAEAQQPALRKSESLAELSPRAIPSGSMEESGEGEEAREWIMASKAFRMSEKRLTLELGRVAETPAADGGDPSRTSLTRGGDASAGRQQCSPAAGQQQCRSADVAGDLGKRGGKEEAACVEVAKDKLAERKEKGKRKTWRRSSRSENV